MQIFDKVGQYNNSLSRPDSITGNKTVEKLVSSISELSSGNIFEGTVNSVSGGKVSLALSNGNVIVARLDVKIPLTEGQSMFFQVKSNNGSQVEIRPYNLNGQGGNPTLLSALDAAGLSVDGRNLSMVNKMMEEQMPIDRNSLSEMARLISSNEEINVSTLVTMNKLGIPVTKEMAAQFENYLNDNQAISRELDSLMQELPELLNDENYSKSQLSELGRVIINLVTEGLSENAGKTLTPEIAPDSTGINEAGHTANAELTGTGEDIGQNAAATESGTASANTLGAIADDKGIEAFNELLKGFMPDMEGNDIEFYSRDSSNVSVLKDMAQLITDNPNVSRDQIKSLFENSVFKSLVKDALEQKWTLKPEELSRGKDVVSKLYEKIDNELKALQTISNIMGKGENRVSTLASDIRSNISFMNQVNELYTYVQVPLKMYTGNTSGELYVYTNKKNMANSQEELSAFLHLDMENLGSTDVSVKMKNKQVSTNFYLQDEGASRLVERFLPQLEQRLNDKGYNCSFKVANEEHHVNFVEDFMKRDKPATGMVHRYSFDMRA